MNAEATTQQDTSDSTHADLIKDEVRIYFYPKIIFLLPTLVFCLLASVYLQFFGSDQPVAANGTQAVVEATADDSASEQAETEATSSPRVTVTVAFMLVFTLNLVVMAFDFPSNRFIALIAFIFLAVAVLWILSEKSPELLGGIGDFLASIKPQANVSFYWMMSVLLGILFLIMYFARKLDYWVIKPNEAIHYHGLPQHSKRYSAHHMRFEMEVNDIFEHFWPFKAGRLYIRPTNEKHEYILDNVLNVRAKNEQANQVLSALQVQLREDAEV